MRDSRSLAYVFLRCTIGLVFLFYGTEKLLGGVLRFAQSVRAEFAGTWLPSMSVYALSVALPFMEITAGALLVLGLFTVFGTSLAGLLITGLTTAKAIEGDSQTVAQNLIFALVIFTLLHFRQDALSLDALRKRRSQKPVA